MALKIWSAMKKDLNKGEKFMYELNLPDAEAITAAMQDDTYVDILEPRTKEDVVKFLRRHFTDVDNEGRICLISPIKEMGGVKDNV